MKNNAKGKFDNFIRGGNNSKYKIGFFIIFSIIASVVLVLLYANTNKEDTVIGMSDADNLQTSDVTEGEIDLLEQASTQIGKNVNQVKNEKEPIIINNEKENKTSNEVQEIKEDTEEKAESKNVLEKNDNPKNQITKKQTESNSSPKKETATSSENKKQEETEENVFAMPTNGKIIKDYAKDNLVYSDTLKEWVTHMGIDIKAEKTSVVKASEKGRIKSIKNDPRYGLTVVIEHSNGYSTVYSNLLTAEFVKVGEQVEKGQTIGTVGDTATFEMADEPHIHFEILKDNVQIDPNMYIK